MRGQKTCDYLNVLGTLFAVGAESDPAEFFSPPSARTSHPASSALEPGLGREMDGQTENHSQNAAELTSVSRVKRARSSK
jgi:hypothetical protein